MRINVSELEFRFCSLSSEGFLICCNIC
jgi:hypothetical protein